MRNKVIVIGGCHHNTLGVLRSLGIKGIFPTLIVITDKNDPYIKYCKYIDEYKQISDIKTIVDYLLSIGNSNDKRIIISCADFVTSYLDLNYDKLSPYYILPLGKKQGVIKTYMDKNKMAQTAIESGFSIPFSQIFTKQSSKIDNIPYPCITKPLNSVDGTKSQIKVFYNNDSLQKYLNENLDTSFIIQEYIDKDIEFQLIGCSLNYGQELIIPGVSIIIRQPQNTNTGLLKYIPIEEFHFDIKLCQKFVQKIGYSGLFSIEFLRDKKGDDYFMEINMRNDGNSICVTASNVNLPYIWTLYNLGLNYKDENTKVKKSIIVMPEFDDFKNVINRKISLIEYIKDIYNTDCFMEYASYDKKPFYILLKQTIKHYINSLIQRIIK